MKVGLISKSDSSPFFAGLTGTLEENRLHLKANPIRLIRLIRQFFLFTGRNRFYVASFKTNLAAKPPDTHACCHEDHAKAALPVTSS